MYILYGMAEMEVEDGKRKKEGKQALSPNAYVLASRVIYRIFYVVSTMKMRYDIALVIVLCIFLQRDWEEYQAPYYTAM